MVLKLKNLFSSIHAVSCQLCRLCISGQVSSQPTGSLRTPRPAQAHYSAYIKSILRKKNPTVEMLLSLEPLAAAGRTQRHQNTASFINLQ